MKERRSEILGTMLLGFLLLLAAGCSTPSINTTPDKDNAVPTDVCTGDACSATADTIGDVKIEEMLPEDNKVPEVKDCAQCTTGTIKCDGSDGYFVCEDDDGCMQWAGKSTACGEQAHCVCEDEGGECEVKAGEECLCVADCEDKDCGNDGCGGSCGECEEGSACHPFNFVCEEISCSECESFCQQGDAECNGEEVSYCINVNADKPGCVECWLFDAVSEPCPSGQTCDSDAGACVCGGGVEACSDECCETVDHVCNVTDDCCLPDCEGKDCGSDGCGGSCGTCTDGTYCNDNACEDVCLSDDKCDKADKHICAGSDGFTVCEVICDACGEGGGICLQESEKVACADNEECQGGECVCIPSCEGKVCGSDGCEGSCGDCDTDNFEACIEGECKCDCEGQPTGAMCDLDTETEYASNCLATCAGATNLQKGPCPTCQDECTENEKAPMDICGFDMATYPNFCELKCLIGGVNCTSLNNCAEVLYPGACKPDCCEDQGCPGDYNPLCGSDGVTYCNKCALQVCGADANAEISCVGECLNPVACPDCADECEPACGLHDGKKKSFGNSCIMECQGGELLWEGECCLQCNEVEEWVCAAEGDTFKAHINDCFQNCQAPEQASLYEIPLLPNGDVWIGLCEDCKCDISVSEPVCGDDYFTYANSCALECAADSNPDNPPVGKVPICETECFTDECPCPPDTAGLPIPGQVGGDGIRGVCGADGNTYGNQCHAAMYGTFVVSQSWCGTCAAVCSDDAYLPVCCAGVTYANSCIADKCNDEINSGNDCLKGKCCIGNEDCDDANVDTVDTCNNGVCENI